MAFKTKKTSLNVIPVFGTIDEDSFYSDDRDLQVRAWVILPADQPDNIWVNSKLVKRRALSKFVEAMQRSEFQDWTSPSMDWVRQENLNPYMERRQYYSGVSLLHSFLQGLTAGIKFASSVRIQIRDYTLWDDCVARAVIALNCCKSGPGAIVSSSGPSSLVLQLRFTYAGVCWAEEKHKSKQVTRNVETSIARSLAKEVRAQTYLHTGWIKPADLKETVTKHELAESGFSLCFPKANLDLPLRQSFIDDLARLQGNMPLGMETGNPKAWRSFDEEIRLHNAEFNPSGVPWRKRRAEEPEPEVTHPTPAVPLDSETVESKEALGSFHAVEHSSKAFKMLVTPDGHVWAEVEKDYTLKPDTPLFCIKGKFVQGEPAREKMESNDSNWIAFDMTLDTPVTVSFKVPMDKTYPSGPTPLKDLMVFLQKCKVVKVSFPSHSIEPVKHSAGEFVITQLEKSCLSVKVEEGKSPSKANICKFVSIPFLKESTKFQVVFPLIFDRTTNRFLAGVPNVLPREPMSLTKGKIQKLI